MNGVKQKRTSKPEGGVAHCCVIFDAVEIWGGVTSVRGRELAHVNLLHMWVMYASGVGSATPYDM